MRLPEAGALFEGRYQILGEIGRGGFGVVLRALDVQTGATVALKVLQPNPAGYPTQVAERFHDEARALGAVSHPNIVRLLGHGQSADGLLYIVMEAAQGGDLSEEAEGPVHPDRVRGILAQVLSALVETHSKGILHRDIKPSNILRTDPASGVVKLVDFGIAKIREPVDGRPGLTATGLVVGTPKYMAPELLLGEPAGPSSDLFALGLVGIELLGGPDLRAKWHRRAMATQFGGDPVPRSLPPIAPAPLLHLLEGMTLGPSRRRIATAASALAQLDGRAPATPPAHRGNEGKTLDHRASSASSAETARTPNAAIIGAFAVVATIFALGMGWVVTQDSRVDEAPNVGVTLATPKLVTEAPKPAAVTPEPQAPEPSPELFEAELSSPGCGSEPPFEGAGTIRSGTLVQRHWRTVVPTNYDPNEAHPLLVVFHADLFSGELMIEHLRLEQLADEQRVVVLAPDFSTFPKAQRRSEYEAMPGAVQALGGQLCLDPARIYVLGYGVGSDGAQRLAAQPWVTALVTGGYFAPTHDIVPPSPLRDRPAPHLYLATMETGVYPVKGGQSCAVLNMRPRISLEEHEELLREDHRCDDSAPAETYAEKGETCFKWNCEVPLMSCHLAGGLYWPGSGIRKWPVETIHGCEVDPTISEFEGTKFAWEFLTAAPPNPPEVSAPWAPEP